MTDILIGIVLLVIIVVIVIIWLRSRQVLRPKKCRRDIDRRFNVKSFDNGKRFNVQSKSSSSSTSSSSDSKNSSDDNCFIPGGLGDLCIVDTQGNSTCSSGLACVDQRCVCPRPSIPTVTTRVEGTNSIVVSWNPVNGADFYEVILYRIAGPGELGPVDIVTVEGLTTMTFADLTSGTYRADVRSGSNQCGLGSDTIAGTSTITLGIVCTTDLQCPDNQTCRGGFCVPVAALSGQGLSQTCLNDNNCASGLVCLGNRCVCPPTPQVQPRIALGPQPNSLTVSWDQTPGVEVFRVVLRRQCTPVPPATTCFSEIVDETMITNSPDVASITFGGLVYGATYFAEIFTGTVACGISSTASPSESSLITVPCVHFVFPSPARVVQSVAVSDGNTRIISISWDPTIPAADLYTIAIQDAAGPAILTVVEKTEREGVVSFVIALVRGREYIVRIFASTPTCEGAGLTDSLNVRFRVNP